MRVAMFTLGGTIAMAGGSDGVIARLTGADLVDAVPGLTELGVDLDVHDAEAVPSASLTVVEFLDLLDAADAAVRAGADGVVVTQGTDSLEETAYLADLIWAHPQPLVVTGAMRNPTLAGPDGPANLLAAVRVAAHPAARELGALVVFDDEIHAARWVRKTHATSTGTFASLDAGPIGWVVEDEVRVLARPRRHEPLARPASETVNATTVALHTTALDDDALLIRHLASGTSAVSGLVVAAFGAGHLPAQLAPLLEELAAAMPVVLTSRTGAGSVLRNTYGAVGSEVDLMRRGLVSGGFLHPYKARLLLRMVLANGGSRDVVEAAFAERGRYGAAV